MLVVDVAEATVPNASEIKPRLRLEHPANVYFSEFSNDGEHLLTVCKDAKVRVWNLRTGQVHSAPISADEDIAGAFRPGHNELLIGDYAGNLNVWDWRAGTRRWPGQRLCREPGTFWAYRRFLTSSPDGRYAALGGTGELYVCDLSPLDETESITPDDLQLRAEVLSGLRMLDNGETISLTSSEWQERAERQASKPKR